jgi:glycosyltransferase involved in cell wall biosynthesis
MCFDRKRFLPNSLAGRFFYRLDRMSCEQADGVLLDTEAHIDYFTETFQLPREKFYRVFVGADESIFHPREVERIDGKFRVFYYSSFLPLHGTEYIVRAAGMLSHEKEIEFVVIGEGIEREKVLALAKTLKIENIRFDNWLSYEHLPSEIAKADICLGGHFSDIDKARRVIAGKTFQFLAMGKPVIVGDCAGNRELLTDRHDALFVRMADAEALADAILELKRDAGLRERIGREGYRTFRESCCTGAVAAALAGIIDVSLKGQITTRRD